MEFTTPEYRGYEDRESNYVPDEPGWLDNVKWEQMELPDITMRVNYDNEDKTD